MKQLVSIIVLAVALALTALTVLVLPNNFFKPYIIKLLKKENVSKTNTKYYKDLDGDKNIEQIEFSTKSKLGYYIEIRKNNKLVEYVTLRNNEQFISRSLKFVDLNNDNFQEIYYLTSYRNQVF